MRLKAFVVILTVCAFLAAVPSAYALSSVEAGGGEVTDAASMVEALGGESAAWINGGGEVCLRSDVVLLAPIRITGGEITLMGASCIIARGFDGGAMIEISGGTLILGDIDNSDKDETVIFDGGADAFISSEGIFSVKSGMLQIYSGMLAENSHADSGGAISITGGEVDMYGGYIKGCSAVSGGGVYISGGSFKMSGGQIIRCEATYGGGAVLIDGGLFAMTGGALGGTVVYDDYSSEATVGDEDGCTAVRGGGLCVNGGSYISGGNDSSDSGSGDSGSGDSGSGDSGSGDSGLNGSYIYGGTIAANHAELGGGVYISDGCDLTLASGTIGYNSAELGGGIYNAGIAADLYCTVCYNDAHIGGGIYNVAGGDFGFYLQGADVNSNTARYAAGVYNADGALFMMSEGSVNYNKADYFGGGLINFGSFTLDAGSLGYNKLVNETKLGTDIFNAGSLVFSNEVFIGGDGDVALLDKDGTEIQLNGPFTCTTTIARVLVVTCSDLTLGEGSSLSAVYNAGRALAATSDEEGDKSGMKYYSTLFAVPSDSSGGAWHMSDDGTLQKDALGAAFWLTAAAIVVVIAAAASYVIILRKKPAKKAIKPQNQP